MKEKDLSAEESFEIIQSMISLSREKLHQTGFHFILWGILVAMASIVQFLMIKQDWTLFPSFWVWPGISVIGGIIAFLYEYNRSKTGRSQSKFDRIYMFLWLGFGVTLVTTIVISVANNLPPVPFILSITGLAVFVSGIIYRFTPLILGSVIFWGAAVGSLFLSPLDQLLLNAGALILGYIIPGILVGKKYVSAA
jgi:hypothetical protein